MKGSRPPRQSRAKGVLKDIMTTKDAAAYLRLTLPTLYRHVAQGKIPCSRIGGRWRFDRKNLDRSLGRKDIEDDVSGRNKISGIVTSIKKSSLLAQVNLDAGPYKLTAIITRDGLDALKLRVGDSAIALIKATEVMVLKEGS
ncbi:MAG: hypothetical protein CMH81_08525 [Nitrospiraceae bacterium]|jgi:molybdopterin-binding protein|nr:hypothetical protein [Nitrospiraceae bacterium]|tara:strand:+ start:1171 stop:1596 length:426 start_codon:yes stop_codon:yes gene_type:complete